jgi:hypothetical protein
MCWFMCCISVPWIITTVVFVTPVHPGCAATLLGVKKETPPPRITFQVHSHIHSDQNVDQILIEMGTVRPLNLFKIYLL